MATYLDGNRRRATANTVTAMIRSAERRKCPRCGRKSAVVHDRTMRATYCRWAVDPSRCTYYSAWEEGQ